MPECDYCGASFDSEAEELNHLKSEHRDELGPIDERRIGDVDDDSGFPVGPLALGVVIFASVAIVGYVVFIAGSSGGSVGAAGSAHYHGSMEMIVLGEEVDFSEQEYQLRDRRFHFEDGDGTEWHAHATGLTFEYAMTSLGFEVSLEPNAITVNGTTYTDGEGYVVVFEIDGNPVTNLGDVLEEGDDIRVEVREA